MSWWPDFTTILSVEGQVRDAPMNFTVRHAPRPIYRDYNARNAIISSLFSFYTVIRKRNTLERFSHMRVTGVAQIAVITAQKLNTPHLAQQTWQNPHPARWNICLRRVASGELAKWRNSHMIGTPNATLASTTYHNCAFTSKSNSPIGFISISPYFKVDHNCSLSH